MNANTKKEKEEDNNQPNLTDIKCFWDWAYREKITFKKFFFVKLIKAKKNKEKNSVFMKKTTSKTGDEEEGINCIRGDGESLEG